MTQVLDEIKQFIEKYNTKFISLKFVDELGSLRQLDIASKRLQTNDMFITNNNMQLLPINNKYFLDPFRSLPTMFCLCENLTDKSDVRAQVKSRIEQSTASSEIPCECYIDFTILENQEIHAQAHNIDKQTTSQNIPNNVPAINQVSETFLGINNESANLEHLKKITFEKEAVYYEQQVEPVDKFSNLRSEIVDILENIGIKTSMHCHGSRSSRCRIGITATDILSMADNLIITRYIIENVAYGYGKLVNLMPDHGISSELILNNKLDNKAIADNTLKLLLYFSDHEKQLARSFVINIQQNLKNIVSFEQAGQDINLSWFEQGGSIVSVNFSTMVTNPYLVLSSIILYGVGYNGNLLSILSKEILGKLSIYYSALSTT